MIASLGQQQAQLQAVQVQQQMNQAATFFINAIPSQQLMDSLGQQQLHPGSVAMQPPFTMTLANMGVPTTTAATTAGAPQAAPTLAGLPIFTTNEAAATAGFHIIPALGLPPSVTGLPFNQLGRLG